MTRASIVGGLVAVLLSIASPVMASDFVNPDWNTSDPAKLKERGR